MSELTLKFRILKVKLTFKLKYDIYEVLRVLYMHRQRFFSSLRKHSYTFILTFIYFYINIHIFLYFISLLIAFIFESFIMCKRLTSMRRRSSAHFYVDNSNFVTYNF